MPDSVLLLLAVVLLTVGHVCRARRWALLLADYQVTRTRYLAGSLAVGYAANLVLPLRLGELVRAVLLRRRVGTDLGLVLATIGVERLVDALSVGLVIALVAPLLGLDQAVRSQALAAGSVGLLTAFAVLYLLTTAGGSRAVARMAGIFNSSIQVFVLHLAWSARQVLVTLTRRRTGAYAVWSVAMWTAYVTSLLALARVLEGPLSAMVQALYLDWWRPVALAVVLRGFGGHDLAIMLVYGVLPLALILAVTRVGAGWLLGRLPGALLGLGRDSTRAPRLFAGAGDYGTFLAGVMAGSQPRYQLLARGLSDDVVVEQDLSGGSDAVTLLVRNEQGLRVRKMAGGEAGARLAEQTRWLRTHGLRLPCAAVLQERAEDGLYSYDMPFDATCVGFFTYLHSRPVDEGRRMLVGLLDELATTLHRPTADGRVLEAADAHAYLDAKVLGTAAFLERHASELWDPAELVVNGQRLPNLRNSGLLDVEALAARLPRRPATDVHGDLTVDNVLVDLTQPTPHWRLIDPNPGQLYPSPALDHGKLLQSLHGGYELLTRIPAPVVLDGNRVDFQVQVTGQYLALAAELRSWLSSRHGPAGQEEALVHEVVHYLRLLPYKLRNQPSHFPAFYGTAVRLAAELVVPA